MVSMCDEGVRREGMGLVGGARVDGMGDEE